MRFDYKILDIGNYKGNAVINYREAEIPYTRILEHKHFEFVQQMKTFITKDYPLESSTELEPYYPINDDKYNDRYLQYKNKASKDLVPFGGRLAEYKYYDMHQVTRAALVKTKKLFEN